MDRNLKVFLDQAGVAYERIPHAQTFTALETAESAHVAGRELAKTEILRADGQYVMAVLTATHSVDLDEMRAATKSKVVEVAQEREFERLFPDCEPGAMPPFGNLYGLRVYVSDALPRDRKIAFNDGTHDELVKMAHADFERLVAPVVGHISYPRMAAV